MAVSVAITPFAESQRKALRSTVEAKFARWLNELKRDGCAAMGYRLTGEVVERLCVRHFHGAWRVVVAFEHPQRAVVVLIGQHDTSDPDHDVYTQLYTLAGVETSSGPRTKPPCCGPDGPPVWGADIDDLVARIQAMRRRRR